MNTGLKALVLATSFAVAGCASIVSKSSWPVSVQSNPTGARCVIANKEGVQVHAGETPLALTLNASSGFFTSQDYSITCDKEGYQTAKAEMPSSLNGWYLGNIIFGGLIGILIVDPATGAMWKLEETTVVNLAKSEVAVNPPEPGPVSQVTETTTP